MRSNYKTFYLKNEGTDKKLLHFEFWHVWLKIVVPRAKIGFWLKGKVP